MAGSTILAGNAQLMKQINRSAILSVIRTQGPIPRAEIAKLTNLTPPTVTNIVGELMEERLVIEGERGHSSGGRKPIMLEINPQAGYILGVDVGSKRFTVLGVDLDANIHAEIERPLPAQPTVDSFLAMLADTLEDAITAIASGNQFAREQLMGIGVGMHGIVDVRQGLGIFAPNLQLREVPIRDYLMHRFSVPVQVDNDVRAMAVGESWFGNARDIQNFVCINVGYGIGAAIVLHHELYRGMSGSAGEIGHITVAEDGLRCSCGNYGCLQAMAAGPAIAQRAAQAIRTGTDSVLSSLVQERLEGLTGAMIHQAALQGDRLAIRVLADTGRYLGISIAQLIHILNPELIIVGGGVAKAGDFLFEPLRKTVEKHSLKLPFANTPIVPAALGEKATAIGAASMSIKALFSPAPM
ncbi:ROK family transcriptional regulator [Fodinisporobacter ferrooxydans]|uniref:ROK family transcriptional regulator n=1 Tax=Fodinisporobacter ferrooxydans TaxID=2901836 RepID=A0ABY4CM13_9BACL|nr:ROK family transcriptional regulator [Alicyclobacillaceae bacterium MYW30-H2]